MQMIFNAISGSSGQVPVMPVDGTRMYYAPWEQLAFIVLAKRIVALLKKCLSYTMYDTLEYCSQCCFLVSALKLCAVLKMHAIPIECNTYIQFPPMGMTGNRTELLERVLNIICISLKFLHTSVWNLPIFSNIGAAKVNYSSQRHLQLELKNSGVEVRGGLNQDSA